MSAKLLKTMLEQLFDLDDATRDARLPVRPVMTNLTRGGERSQMLRYLDALERRGYEERVEFVDEDGRSLAENAEFWRPAEQGNRGARCRAIAI